MNWQLTEQQAEQLAAILDLATKAGGLEVAKVTVALMGSLMAAVSKSKQETIEPDKG